MKKYAFFSEDRKHRYYLSRVWDDSLPKVMFIGLNPSTANENEDDPTIRRVMAISERLGYGGVYMCNCFSYVSTDPRMLVANNDNTENDKHLLMVKELVRDVIFAWGNFRVVSDLKRDLEIFDMFPRAMALQVNKNGSPKHPLYVKTDIIPVNFNQK